MRRDKIHRTSAFLIALAVSLTGCQGKTGRVETTVATQEIATSGVQEQTAPSSAEDITTVDALTTENMTEEDTTAVKETTDQETESEEESTAEETTAEEPTAEETEEPTAEEETTPETTAEPTTAEPTTPEPTTVEPTTPEPTTPEPTTPEPTTVEPTTEAPTMPVETTPAVVAESITGSVNGTHYIGDNLSAADFTITVTMSDGSKLTNPAGFAVSPLNISSATTTFTCAYADVSGTFSYTASEKPATQPTQPTTPTSVSVNGMDVVKNAIQYIGVPYVHGGTNLATGSDCSNFTRLLYAQYGVSLSGSAAGQFDQGTPITYEQLKPGDLVVQKYAPGTSQYTGHVAMFIGTDERGWGIVINEYPDQGVVVGYIMQDEIKMYEYRRGASEVMAILAMSADLAD
ncbi:MAG: C40 family peptidase, partial [Lachnospiraceae bacterium]|nr:C40 family peptidase [Lachnospiraceae bacterium]